MVDVSRFEAGAVVVETIEQVREVAKEARAVLMAEELYGGGEGNVVTEFTNSLAPAFQGPRP